MLQEVSVVAGARLAPLLRQDSGGSLDFNKGSFTTQTSKLRFSYFCELHRESKLSHSFTKKPPECFRRFP